jgi:hypothetical protein
MSGVSRFISFVIGLIVLILLFVLIANRFNVNKAKTVTANTTPTVTPVVSPAKSGGFDFFGLFRRNTPTPSPTPTLTFAQQMDSTMGNVNGANTSDQLGNPNPRTTISLANTYQNNQNLKTTPKTGTETLLLPLASAAFAAGMWLRRRS